MAIHLRAQRKHILLVALICTAFAALHSSRARADQDPADEMTTTIFVVRHAQKADPNNNAKEAQLSDAGRHAAQRLATILRSARIEAAFATPTVRARDTAQPCATFFGLTVTDYASPDHLAEQILREWSGRSVLVVGHSNTVPAIVRSLGGRAEGDLGSDEYDNLFIVTITQSGAQRIASTVRLRLPD